MDIKGYILLLFKVVCKVEVKLIVFLFIQSVDKNKWMFYYKIEQVIEQSGLNYIFLCFGFFMQNFFQEIKEDIVECDELFVLAGSNCFFFIDMEELVEVVVKFLLEGVEEFQKFIFMGMFFMDYYWVVIIVFELLGCFICYSNFNLLWFIIWKLMWGCKLMFVFIQVVFYWFNWVFVFDQYWYML